MPFAGWKLRELRRRRALTLRELAALSGVAYDTIHGVEIGQHQPRPSTIRKLADALEGRAGCVLYRRRRRDGKSRGLS